MERVEEKDTEKNSQKFIEEESRKRLLELYGENPSEEILERYNKELKSILDNEFANIYYFRYLICKKAKSDGEIVQIRGCGSCSFIAYLLGISYINPIEYNLEYEVFAGADYNKLPDFDLSFSIGYKEQVLEYIKKYPKNEIRLLWNDNLEVLKRLEKMTGVNHNDIDIQDKRIIEQIKRSPDGLFEFHNEYIRKIVDKANPQTIDDLVKVSAISHGTKVWEDNYEKLIENGYNISELLCSREDIFEYLKSKGISNEYSYRIMDFIRKGFARSNIEKDISDWKKYVEITKKYGVEDWKIKSFEKMVYVFPKSHALNIVIIDLWITWYKINYPKSFILEEFTNIELSIDRMKMKQIKKSNTNREMR